jgi:hypothetical protein
LWHLAPSILVPEPPANSHARQGDVFRNPFDAEIWKRENSPPLLDPFFAKDLPIALYFVAGDHDDYEIESQIGPVYKIMREHNFDVASYEDCQWCSRLQYLASRITGCPSLCLRQIESPRVGQRRASSTGQVNMLNARIFRFGEY